MLCRYLGPQIAKCSYIILPITLSNTHQLSPCETTSFLLRFLILLRFGLASSETGCWCCWGTFCCFFLIDNGFGPLAIFVFIWMPFWADSYLIFCFFYSAFCFSLSSLTYLSYFSAGINLSLMLFSSFWIVFLCISSIVILWSGPKYTRGTF